VNVGADADDALSARENAMAGMTAIVRFFT
jgi:hypothetical protein